MAAMFLCFALVMCDFAALSSMIERSIARSNNLWSCHTGLFCLQPGTQRHCEASCRRNSACNTLSMQLAAQWKIPKLSQLQRVTYALQPTLQCTVAIMGEVGEKANQNWVLTWAREKSNMAKSKTTDNQVTLSQMNTGRLILKKKNLFFLRWRVRRIRVWSTKADMVCFSPGGFGV